MPFCPKCGKEALETDKFCLNCGAPLDRATEAPAPFQASMPTAVLPSSLPASSKSPLMAAVLNFVLPGVGYIYVGAGRDGKLMVFGLLVLVSLTLTFYVSILNIATSPPTTSPTSTSPLDFIGLLEFIFPFAAAYDAFQRAKR